MPDKETTIVIVELDLEVYKGLQKIASDRGVTLRFYIKRILTSAFLNSSDSDNITVKL